MRLLVGGSRRSAVWCAGFVAAAMTVLGCSVTTNAAGWYDAILSPASVYSWQGFYVGFNVGWGWDSSPTSQNSISAPPKVYEFSQGGNVIGGTAGFNWQTSNFVLGVEGDWDWALFNDTAAGCPTACDTTVASIGTLRPRIGFTFGNFMPYVTGGFAWGLVKANQAGFENSRWQSGYVIGAGIEALFSPNWSAKAEFLQITLQNSADPNTRPIVNQGSIAIARFGLNRHFNAAPAQVATAPLASSDWSGLYLGANGGWGWSNVGHLGTTVDPNVGFYRFPQSGVLYGGTIGNNWQSGKLVYGVEGDWDWADVNGSGLNPAGAVCPTGCYTKVGWLGTLRPRVGVALGDFLPYVTGGVAWSLITAGEPGFANSHWQPGLVVGAGVEMMFAPNWSAKTEFLVSRVNDSSYTAAAPVSVNQRDIAMVRAGINYHPKGCFFGLC